jgi:alkylation response protein AidB-like acyl-CoA dehydrogenase
MSRMQLQLAAAQIPPEDEALRQEIRPFLAEALAGRTALERSQSWMGFDPEFSRRVGDRNWIGMTWPKQYGGGERSLFARYVVAEEFLAAGAPVSAHWFADRQTGPLLLRFGTEEQRTRYLPQICRGTLFFCIGMSEPDSGSDLASIRTRATRTDAGWTISGRKVWTTNAHRSHYMLALVRTGDEQSRQAGLSQMIVDLKSPGVSIRPIRDLTGAEHFNEVLFEDVHVGRDALVGEEGSGWAQVTAELALERSGPERYLSSIALMTPLLHHLGAGVGSLEATVLGRVTARAWALRQMSLAVTARLAAGDEAGVAAACYKDLGTAFEQAMPEEVRMLTAAAPAVRSGDDLAQTLANLTQLSPTFSLRGGTREILRGIIARGLGLR